MATLDAFGLVVRDMRKSLDFYRMVGLEVPEGAESEGHVDIELDGGVRLMLDTVEVVQSFSEWEPATGGHRIGLAARCGSPAAVDATHQRLIDAGNSSMTAPFDAPWGQRYATVADPDGNPVDLYAAL